MKEFFKPEQAEFLLPEIIPVYQAAFAGEPWFEVSKCADASEIQKCIGGFSKLKIGETCELCGNCPIKEAYEKEELIEKFKNIAETRPTAWYLEGNEQGITLATLAWVKTPLEIAKERYLDNPKMDEWMSENLGEQEIIWLDETFADKSKKPFGNMKNFREMSRGFADIFGIKKMALRTINDKVVAVAKRDFPENSIVFKREVEVPDRRDFILINAS